MIGFIIVSISFIFTVYLYVTRHFNYWKDRGVPFIKPTPFFGNLGPIFRLKCSIGDYLMKLHFEHENEPFIGMFLADKPCLLVRDLDLIMNIMKSDALHFDKRILEIPRKTDLIGSKSLFVLNGKEWKNTRARISPVFTPKKHKVAFDAVLGVGQEFEHLMAKDSEVNVKQLSYGNAADFLSNVIFGIEGKAMADPDNDIVWGACKNIFNETINQALRSNIAFLAPEILKALRMSVFPNSSYQVMKSVVKFVLENKENLDSYRGDYVDTLLDLRKKGPWEGNNGEMIVMDDDTLTSQFFMFFTAGFETVASGSMFCLFEAASNQDIQEKLRKEIRSVIASNDGKITYDCVKQMSYLDNFVNECLRKHTPFPFADRVCSMNYKIPGTNIVIEKGTKILFSMKALHNDEKYYENPEKIIPERFDDVEGMREKPYMPFSCGSRICLGMSLGMLIYKINLIFSLRNHKLTLSDKTPKVLTMAVRRFVCMPSTDIILNIEKVN